MMMNNQADDLSLIIDIYATLNPGGYTGQVDRFGPTGMTLRYVTIEEDPTTIEGDHHAGGRLHSEAVPR